MGVTLHFQSTGSVPGRGAPTEMRGPSLTIGRADDNDLVLPDPDRTVSKRHAVIEDHDGEILVRDHSSNGTFLNYGKTPLGAAPTPLNDGDILTIGPYELMVQILRAPAGGGIADPLAEEAVSPGDASRVSTADLLDDPGGGGDFLDELLGEAPKGHTGVRRPDLGDDGVLPPLADDDLLPPSGEPVHEGPSFSSHNAALEDHVAIGAPQTVEIPDDWDDLLEGIGPDDDAPAGTPFAEPPPETPLPGPAAEEEAPPAPGRVGIAVEGPETPMSPHPPAPPDPLADAPPGPGDGPEQTASAGAWLETPAVTSRPGPAPAEPKAPPAAPRPAARPAEARAGPAPDAAQAAVAAYLDALGVGSGAVTEEELAAVMSRMGHMTRIMVQGLREVLMTRTDIKDEFGIQRTRLASGGNSPLKWSVSAEQAVSVMVRNEPGYLDAVEAADQAIADIKAHEVAMVTGLQAAMRGLLERLAPEKLEAAIEGRSGGLGGMFKGRKALSWEAYTQAYAALADEAEADFRDLFRREFARAYQDQLERLK